MYLHQYVALCAAVATVLGAASTVKVRDKDTGTQVMIFVVRAVHFFTQLTLTFYLIARGSKRVDVAYLVVILLVIAHWQIFGECVLSYVDERLVDPAYAGRVSGVWSVAYVNDLLGPKPATVFIAGTMTVMFVTYVVVLGRVEIGRLAKALFAAALVALAAVDVFVT